MENARKTAAVLAGGGAYGAYEVGVLLALTRGLSAGTGYRPWTPSVYTGTSVGAFNAAFMASRWEQSADAAAADLARIWCKRIADQGDGGGNGVFRYRFDPRDLLNPLAVARSPLRTFARCLDDCGVLTAEALRMALEFLAHRRLSLDQRILSLIALTSLISTAPLGRTVRESIDFGLLRRSPHPLRVTATDWNRGDLLIFENKNLSDELGPFIVQGSGSIPGILPPFPVGPWRLVDGGVLMNLPLKPAVQAGATEIHLIHLFPALRASTLPWLSSTLGSLEWSQVLSWSSTRNHDLLRVALINDRLKVAREVRRRLESSDLRPRLVSEILEAFTTAAHLFEPTRYRLLTVHNYQPRRALKWVGPLTFLQFQRHQIEDLIQQGYSDAQAHDCRQAGCILADAAEPGPGPADLRRSSAGSARRT